MIDLTPRHHLPAALCVAATALTLALSTTAVASPPAGSCVSPVNGAGLTSLRCTGPTTPAPIAPVAGGVGQRAPQPAPMPYPLPAPDQL
jgi:hypothetical protein